MITVSKGDVWFVEFPQGVGHEQAGARTAVVLAQEKKTGMVIVAPTTKNLDSETLDYTYPVIPSRENGLDLESVVLIHQLESSDKKRFIRKFGRLEKKDIDALDAILLEMFKLTPKTEKIATTTNTVGKNEDATEQTEK